MQLKFNGKCHKKENMLSIIGANTYFCIRNLVANATKKRTEVDFVCNSFKKIIITGEPSVVHRDNNGITTISIYDFLLNANSLEM